MTDRVSDWWLFSMVCIAVILGVLLSGCPGANNGAQQGAVNQQASAKTSSSTSQTAGRDAINTTESSAENAVIKGEVSNNKLLMDMRKMNGNRAFQIKEMHDSTMKAFQKYGMSGWEVCMIVLASGVIARIDDILSIVWRRIRKVKT